MGDPSTSGNKGSGVPAWPPPPIPLYPSPPRAASMLFAAAAAVAGFLGYCNAAGGLAVLSLAFNLWDYYGSRGAGRPRGGGVSGGGVSGGGSTGQTSEGSERGVKVDSY
jgi:hypothetical protein